MGHSMDLSCSEASVELAEDTLLEAASPSDFIRAVCISDSERRTSFEKRLLAKPSLQVGCCAFQAQHGQNRVGLGQVADEGSSADGQRWRYALEARYRVAHDAGEGFQPYLLWGLTTCSSSW